MLFYFIIMCWKQKLYYRINIYGIIYYYTYLKVISNKKFNFILIPLFRSSLLLYYNYYLKINII